MTPAQIKREITNGNGIHDEYEFVDEEEPSPFFKQITTTSHSKSKSLTQASNSTKTKPRKRRKKANEVVVEEKVPVPEVRTRSGRCVKPAKRYAPDEVQIIYVSTTPRRRIKKEKKEEKSPFFNPSAKFHGFQNTSTPLISAIIPKQEIGKQKKVAPNFSTTIISRSPVHEKFNGHEHVVIKSNQPKAFLLQNQSPKRNLLMAQQMPQPSTSRYNSASVCNNNCEAKYRGMLETFKEGVEKKYHDLLEKVCFVLQRLKNILLSVILLQLKQDLDKERQKNLNLEMRIKDLLKRQEELLAQKTFGGERTTNAAIAQLEGKYVAEISRVKKKQWVISTFFK